MFAGHPAASAAAGVACFAVLAALYATFITNARTFDPRYSLYTDVSNFYWIQALLDRSLFPRDPLSAFYVSHVGPFNTEAAWIWFTSLFMHAVPYVRGLRVLFVLGCAAGALLFFRLAAKTGARPAAAAAAVIFTVYFLSMNTFFGVPRIYGFFSFLGFLLAAEEKHFLVLPFFVFAAFIFYPAAAVGLAFSALLVPVFYRAYFAEKKLFARYAGAVAFSALLCLAALWRSVALAGLVRAFGAGSGFETYKQYQFVADPINLRNLADMFLYYVMNFNEHGRFYSIMSGLLGLVFVAGYLRKPGRPGMIPYSMKVTLAGCLAAFAALYVMHPVSASRQTIYIVPMLLVFLAVDGLCRLSGGKFRTAAVAAGAGAVFAVLCPYFGVTDSCRKFAPVYDYLSAAPADAIVAGHPVGVLLYTVPVFARKQVFVSDEYRDQYILNLEDGGAGFTAMRAALVSALYAGTPAEACALGPAYGVGYVVLEDQFFTPEYFARTAVSPFPQDADITRAVTGSSDPLGFYDYARKHPAFSWKNEESGGVVFDLSACGKKLPGGSAKRDRKKPA